MPGIVTVVYCKCGTVLELKSVKMVISDLGYIWKSQGTTQDQLKQDPWR